jgi:hypothetical protein
VSSRNALASQVPRPIPEAADYRQTCAMLAKRDSANQTKPAEIYEDVLGFNMGE